MSQNSIIESRLERYDSDHGREQEKRRMRLANKAKGRLLKSLSRKGFEFDGHTVNKIDGEYVIVIRMEPKFESRIEDIPTVHESYKVDCQFFTRGSTVW